MQQRFRCANQPCLLPAFFRRAALFLAGATSALSPSAAISSAGQTPSEPTPGTLVEVVCAHNTAQSYAVYLPSNYTTDRAWPIVYCFDAGARGRLPVERYRRAAEFYGYIVVGSNNSRNHLEGSKVEAAIDALLRDTRQRFRLDARRQYTAGCSGGARVACAVATTLDFAGIIASSGGFPDSVVPPKVIPAFFGTTGREDFNYGEMKQVDAALAAQHARHFLAIFEGGHEWLPEPLTVEALEWMEVQAMRSGLRPRDEALIGNLLRKRLQAVAALHNAGEAYVGYLAVTADFTGLADVSESTGKAAALQDTKPVRQYFKDEKKAEQQEQSWRERIEGAVETAKNWTPFQGLRDGIGPRRRLLVANNGMGGRDDEASQDFARGSRTEEWPPADFDNAGDPDRYATLRAVVNEITRQSKTNVAARRALSGAFGSWTETGSYQMGKKDYAAAAECFEVAAIIRPESPGPHVALVQAYVRLGDKSKARQSLHTALAKGFKDAERIEQLQALVTP